MPCADPWLKRQQCFLQVRMATHDERIFVHLAPAELPASRSAYILWLPQPSLFPQSSWWSAQLRAQDAPPPPSRREKSLTDTSLICPRIWAVTSRITPVATLCMTRWSTSSPGRAFWSNSLQMTAVNPAHALLFDRLSIQQFRLRRRSLQRHFSELLQGPHLRFPRKLPPRSAIFRLRPAGQSADSACVHTVCPCP